jgi:hypothetical protein
MFTINKILSELSQGKRVVTVELPNNIIFQGIITDVNLSNPTISQSVLRSMCSKICDPTNPAIPVTRQVFLDFDDRISDDIFCSIVRGFLPKR